MGKGRVGGGWEHRWEVKTPFLTGGSLSWARESPHRGIPLYDSVPQGRTEIHRRPCMDHTSGSGRQDTSLVLSQEC